MKTAREIIAELMPFDMQRLREEKADAILAALAAEGFSIVETGRDPACDWNKVTYGNSTVPGHPFSRSAKEGQT